MAGEIKSIKDKTRKVKNHIIDRYLRLAERIDKNDDLSDNEKAKYWELTTIFAKSVLPRTQEVTGEDGDPIKIAFDPVFNSTPNAKPTSETEGDSTTSSPV